MPRKPVDTAIVVGLGPAIDDTNFKSLETSIAWDAAGLTVVLFKETAGVITQTPITPTNPAPGGDYDWSHLASAMYQLEIPAADNDTKGYLWVTAIADGVLIFVSPVYEVVSANAYNALVADTDKLQVDLVEVNGATAPVDNLADDYDGTGYNKSASTIGTVTNVSDKTGYALSAAGVLAIWDQLTSGLTAAGSIGKKLADWMILTSQAIRDALKLAPSGGAPAAGSIDEHLDDMMGATFDTATDSLEAIRNRGDADWSATASNPNVLLDTTVSSVTSQTEFVLAAGPNDDDVLNDQAVVLYDADNSDSPCVRTILNYEASTTTITIDSAPDFTVVSGDGVKAFLTPPGTTAPSAVANAAATLNAARSSYDVAGSIGEAIGDAHAYAGNLRTLDRATGALTFHEDGATPASPDPRFTLTPDDTTDPDEVAVEPS